MQRMPQKDPGLSSSRQSFYYPPTRPRQAHYPTTIQVRRRGRGDLGEAFIKRVQGINIDKRYGFLLAILLLFFCLGAVIRGSHASLSAQASENRPSSSATHVVQIVRPHWQDLNHTATPTPKTGAKRASTSTSRSPSVAVSQPFVTFTDAYAINHIQGVVSVHTLPGAALTINITYCSGQHATSPLLRGVSYADSSGNYVWTWKPKASCTGLAAARVTASIHGQAISQSYMFRLE